MRSAALAAQARLRDEPPTRRDLIAWFAADRSPLRVGESVASRIEQVRNFGSLTGWNPTRSTGASAMSQRGASLGGRPTAGGTPGAFASAVSRTGTGEETIFAVIDPSTDVYTSQGSQLGYLLDNSGGRPTVAHILDTTSPGHPGLNGTVSPGVTTADPQILEWTRDALGGTNAEILRDGTSLGTFTTGDPNWSGTGYFMGGNAGGNNYWGTWAEFLFYERKLNAVERSAVRRWLGAKYGIKVAS